MGIFDRRQIGIKADPERVFEFIQSMPMKFPTLKILDTKPILFFRMTFVDGIKSGLNVLFNRDYYNRIKNEDQSHCAIGSSFGPFTLTEVIKARKYFFTVDSYFLKCQTGYILHPSKYGTDLYFDTIADNPGTKEKIWWFMIKPFHSILANIVLYNIKNGIEQIKE